MSSSGPQVERGGEFSRPGLEAEIAGIAERHDIPLEVAALIAMEPLGWINRLREGEDDLAVAAHAVAQIEAYEAKYGPSTDWDVMRIALGKGLLACSGGNIDRAVTILSGTSDGARMLDDMMGFFERAVTSDAMSMTEARFIVGKLLDELPFDNDEALDNFLNALSFESLSLLAKYKVDEVGASEAAALPEITDFATAREYYPQAPWEVLEALAQDASLWPSDMDTTRRNEVSLGYGLLLRDAFASQTVERKAAEALKAYVNERQGEYDGEIWDRMRFLGVSGLYAGSYEKFGFMLTRSMRDPEMMSAVAQLLISDGRDDLAFEVAQVIPDVAASGRLLAFGKWNDRTPIDAFIEDITFVTVRTRRKHDPARRLDVARGVHLAYAERAAEDPAWNDHAEIMRKRVKLLERQINMGYIKPNGKK